jgi:hypothetical protein
MGILIGAMLIITWQAALGVVAFANLASGSLLLWACARASRELAFPVHLI